MRIIAPLLLVALAASAEGAALVRFINTVPTRTARASFTPFTASVAAATAAAVTGGAATAHAAIDDNSRLRVRGENNAYATLATNRVSLNQDRVGLLYYGDAANPFNSPTVVQTQIVELGGGLASLVGGTATTVNAPSDVATGTTGTPYPWYHAMPALRGYHDIASTGAVDTTLPSNLVDLPFGSSASVNNGGNNAVADYYESSQLRADGVGNYLSFAAGTYSYAAYSVMSAVDTLTKTSTVSGLGLSVFTASRTSFTLVDGKVYTLLAVGDGQYNALVPRTGNTVRLVLIEESVAPVTYGMSALRFVHAITSQSDKVIDVYNGSGFTSKIASGIAFGAVSDYVDVAPAATAEFPLAYGTPGLAIASGVPVQREVRAGSRVTVICAHNNIQNIEIFCRGIPSRAVAYVRLIVDTAGLNSLVLGKAGHQRLADTKLSLFASYGYPRPDVLSEASQVSSMTAATGAAATLDGLYPVVINVASGVASGYGEVHVPLHIMDYALRPLIGQANLLGQPTATGGAAVVASVTAPTQDFAVTANQLHYLFAPVLKRASFVVKTDGFATLSGRNTARRNSIPLPAFGQFAAAGAAVAGAAALKASSQPLPTSTADPEFNTIVNAITTDEYVEAGQFYSLVVSGSYGVTNADAAGAQTVANIIAPVSNRQDAGIVKFAFNLDRSLARVASAVLTSTQGIVSLYPIAVPAIAVPVTTNAGNAAVSVPGIRTQPQSFAVTNMYFYENTNAANVQTATANNVITITPKTSGSPITISSGTQRNAVEMRGTFVVANAPAALDGNENIVSANSFSLTFAAGTPSFAAAVSGGGAAAAASNAAAFMNCFNFVPAGDFTLNAGSIVDLMVFGSTACFTPNAANSVALAAASASGTITGTADQSKLSLKAVVRQSAVSSGHSPFASSRRSAADVEISTVDVPLYNAASSSTISIFLAVVMSFLAALML